MQSRALLCIAMLAPVLVSVAWAQKFKEPSKEELQMTSDPKAPGADAVYLDREVRNNNDSHYISEYERIKVLTEKGKARAVVEIPFPASAVDGMTLYMDVATAAASGKPVIDGRAIHSDGTVVPFAGDYQELHSAAGGFRGFRFTLPGAEIGSILEYRWTMPLVGNTRKAVEMFPTNGTLSADADATSIPTWQVQTDLFAHRAYFYFNPYSFYERLNTATGVRNRYFADGEIAHNLLYAANLPAGAQVVRSPRNDYTLEVYDVPAAPREENTPPESSYLYRVRFYYSPATDVSVFWGSEQARWSKRMDEFATQSDSIRQAAEQITAGAATPEAKARKLYEAVQGLQNTEFSRSYSAEERRRMGLKRELKKAQDVWAEKGGTPNELAALYLALARASGLDANAIEVVDRSENSFDPNMLSLLQLNSLLVTIHIDGKDIFLDPGEKFCPFGQLAWNHSLAGGLQQKMNSPIFTPANLSKDSILAHSGELTLDATGGVSGSAKVLMTGPAALRWRQLSLTVDAGEVRRQFMEEMERQLPRGLHAEFDTFQGMETGEGNLTAVLRVSGQLASATGKRLVVPAFIFSNGLNRQFVDEPDRKIPVDLHYTEQIIDDVIYHLPQGYTVESAPPATQIPWAQHAALVTKTTSAPGVIDIKHIYARTFVLLDAKEYSALREFSQKVATTDQQQLVLSPAASVKN